MFSFKASNAFFAIWASFSKNVALTDLKFLSRKSCISEGSSFPSLFKILYCTDVSFVSLSIVVILYISAITPPL